MSEPFEIIKRPIVTEKSTQSAGDATPRYAFEVALGASKGAIRQALESFFKVKVASVRTLTLPGKRRRVGRYMSPPTPWKKAIVTLAAGQKIEMLEAK